MTSFESTLVAILGPLVIAVIAWLRAEAANRRSKITQQSLARQAVTQQQQQEQPKKD